MTRLEGIETGLPPLFQRFRFFVRMNDPIRGDCAASPEGIRDGGRKGGREDVEMKAKKASGSVKAFKDLVV